VCNSLDIVLSVQIVNQMPHPFCIPRETPTHAVLAGNPAWPEGRAGQNRPLEAGSLRHTPGKEGDANRKQSQDGSRTISAAVELGWSYRRTRREPGARRETAARYDPKKVRTSQDRPYDARRWGAHRLNVDLRQVGHIT